MAMKTLKKCAVLLLLPVAAAAWSDEAVRLVSSVAKVERITNDWGEPQTRLVAAERVVRGDELQYSIDFANHGDEPVAADSIVITSPVPEHTVYLADSASGQDTDIVFSADAGESWGPPGSLMRRSEGGAPQRAEAADYTHVRWTFRRPLEPGRESSVAFRVRLQ